MRRIKSKGNFLLNLVINLAINLDGTIPAFVLLALHFWLGISIIWFWVLLGVWLVSLIFRMIFINWVSDCSNEHEKNRQNKNPYSAAKYPENGGEISVKSNNEDRKV